MKNQKPAKIPLLQQLPAVQFETLIHWLIAENMPYKKARRRLAAEFGVSTTESGLCKFWQQVCIPRINAPQRTMPLHVGIQGRTLVEIQVRLMPDNTLGIVLNGSNEVIVPLSRAAGSEQRAIVEVCQK